RGRRSGGLDLLLIVADGQLARRLSRFTGRREGGKDSGFQSPDSSNLLAFLFAHSSGSRSRIIGAMTGVSCGPRRTSSSNRDVVPSPSMSPRARTTALLPSLAVTKS